ncbi:hypothetical protein [Eubacterium callanderi]|nr:hypothetical protein [Eubacterium callanderi]
MNSQTKQQSGIMKIKFFEYNIELFKKNVYNIKKEVSKTMYKSTKWVEMGTWWSRCTLFDREIGYLIKSGGRGGSRFLFSENKKEKPCIK